MIDNSVYLIEGGNVYKYHFIGDNEPLTGSQARNIKNHVFNDFVRNGIDIPIPDELMPNEEKISSSPIQKLFNKFNSFFFNQIYLYQ